MSFARSTNAVSTASPGNYVFISSPARAGVDAGRAPMLLFDARARIARGKVFAENFDGPLQKGKEHHNIRPSSE